MIGKTLMLTASTVLTVLLGACSGQPSQERSSKDLDAVKLEQIELVMDKDIRVQDINSQSSTTISSDSVLKRDGFSAMMTLLINEFAAMRDPEQIEINDCLRIAEQYKNLNMARRCYELSVHNSDAEVPVRAAQLWVTIAPDSKIAHQQLGQAYVVNQRYDEALDSLFAAKKKGIDVDVIIPAINSVFLYGDALVKLTDNYRKKRQERPQNQELLLGEIILQTRRSEQNYYIGNYQDALASLNELIALDLDANTIINGATISFERPYLFRARSMHRLGRGQEAISGLEQAIAKHPDYISLYVELTEFYLQANSYAQAEKTVLELLKKNKSGNVYYEVGKIIASSPLSQAMAVIRQRFIHDSSNSSLPVRQRELALWRLGTLTHRAYNNSSRKKYLARISSTPELVAAATSEIATIVQEEREQNAGEAVFDQARERWPGISQNLWEAQAQWLARTDRAKAIVLLNQIIVTNPAERLIYMRGLYYALDGNIEAMENDFRQILAKNPGHVDTLNAYGYTLVDLTDRTDEGTDMITRAFALDPKRPSIVDSLGWAYYRQGKMQQALVLLHWAYSRLQDAEIGAHYGEVLWSLDHKEEARMLLEQELRKEPDNYIIKNTLERLFNNTL